MKQVTWDWEQTKGQTFEWVNKEELILQGKETEMVREEKLLSWVFVVSSNFFVPFLEGEEIERGPEESVEKN